MRLSIWSIAIVLAALVAEIPALAQRGATQSASPRPSAASPSRPGGARTESSFRSSLTFDRHTRRPAPSPQPFRAPIAPLFPTVWGWGGVPVYAGIAVQPLQDGPKGGVQLDVQPWRASVFVDGVRVGRVENFKGYYRHLELPAGPHQIVIVEDGYQPLLLEIVVPPGETVTYRGTLTENLR